MFNKIHQYIAAVLVVGLIGCISYDRPLIYQKNFKPGTHASLRFDGYYSQENANKTVRPVFLFRDGSVYFAEEDVQADLVPALVCTGDRAAARHSWGNYKIDADTIYIERFIQEGTTGNFNRIILKGSVSADNIQWSLRTYHRSEPDTISYGMKFYPNTCKPDSTKNWTRTRPQFNK